jgi:hypothetical protein
LHCKQPAKYLICPTLCCTLAYLVHVRSVAVNFEIPLQLLLQLHLFPSLSLLQQS